MPGGNLKNFTSKHLPLTQEDLLFFLAQLLVLVEDILKEGKLYLNLTLENILVKENGYLVVNGLERTLDFKREQETKVRKIFGNPYYFSPEAIALKGYHEEMLVWRLGVIAYYLLTGNYPFRGKNIKELYNRILTEKVEGVPEFVLKMLEKDQLKRISLRELREYP